MQGCQVDMEWKFSFVQFSSKLRFRTSTCHIILHCIWFPWTPLALILNLVVGGRETSTITQEWRAKHWIRIPKKGISFKFRNGTVPNPSFSCLNYVENHPSRSAPQLTKSARAPVSHSINPLTTATGFRPEPRNHDVLGWNAACCTS